MARDERREKGLKRVEKNTKSAKKSESEKNELTPWPFLH